MEIIAPVQGLTRLSLAAQYIGTYDFFPKSSLHLNETVLVEF